jgi:peptidoglycan/LPS O-acetylase OafA/YrhL
MSQAALSIRQSSSNRAGSAGSSSRIPCLDGLRAGSIVLVMAAHVLHSYSDDYHSLANEIQHDAGRLGVLTFFVISGYLITYLLFREWQKRDSIDLKAFYTRRVLRIFPAFFTYLGVIAALAAVGIIATTRGDLLLAATFMKNYKAFFDVATNPDELFVRHFWTLALEEQFYLFWPMTFLLVGIARASRVALAIVLISPIMRIATYFLFPGLRGNLAMMLHCAADPIMAGCLAALWQNESRVENVLARLSHWVWPSAIVGFLLFVSPMCHTLFEGAYTYTIGMTLDSMSIVFLLLWLVRHPTSFAGQWLERPIVRHIGVLSYSLYLWQQPFLTSLNHTWSGLFPINLLASLVAAECSHWFIERPFLILKDSLRKRESLPSTPRRPLPMRRLALPVLAE